MNFIFIFVILTILIISNKLFLFNEEFLILLSFCCFCFIIYTKLGDQLENRFKNKTLELEKLFLSSLNIIVANLTKKKKLNAKLKYFKNIYLSLKKYYLEFSKQFLVELLIYKNNQEKSNFLFKLITFSTFEKDYLKFITLLLTKKLNQINKILNFFNLIVKIKKIQTIMKINRISLIKKI